MTNPLYANRIKEGCTASGTAHLTLLGAVSGFTTFTSKIQTGQVVPYVLLDGNGVDYEVGWGTLASPSELQRTTVLDSSQTNDRVNSSTAGTPVKINLSTNQHEVFLGTHHRSIFVLDTNGNINDPSPIRAALFVDTIAAMTAMANLDAGETVFVKGSATATDGLGAIYRWDPSDASSASNPETYAHDTDSGLFKKLRFDATGLIRNGVLEVDAAVADTTGASIYGFFRKKATASTAWFRWLADYASSSVQLGVRYGQASAEKIFAKVFSIGDNTDRLELLEPVTLPSRTNSNGLKVRALAWLSGVSRLGFAEADAANSATAADYWELALTKGGYALGHYATTTALRAIDAVKFAYDGQVAYVLGLSAIGDITPFQVQWSAASSATHDGWSVFRPSTGAAASGNGRWLRTNVNPTLAFTNSDATPSIANGNFFTTAGTPPAAITDFDDAYEGQLFVVQRGSANQTITHNASVIDCGGQDLVLSPTNPRAVFVHVNGIHRLIANFENQTPNVFRPERYGAVGDGSTDDNAALQAAVTACQANAGGIVLLSKLYATSVKIAVTASNVHVVGQGKHTGFTALGASAITMLGFEAAAVTTTTTYATNNVAKGGKTITFTSVTGFAVGDVIMVRVTKASGYYTSALYCLVATIKSISSNDVTIDRGVPLPLTPGADTVKDIWKLPMLNDVSAENMAFYKGANSHADTRGMNFWSIRRGLIDRCCFFDMTGNGVYMSTGLDNEVGTLWFQNAGSIGYSVMEMEGQTGLNVGSLHSTALQGFGPRLYRSAYCNVQSSIVNGAGFTSNGRGFKFAQTLACHANMLVCNGSASATGCGISEGSCDNVIDCLIANDNANEALWFSDQSNNNNLVKSVQAYGNGGGSTPAISVYPSDNDNVILNIDTDATVGGSAANSLYFAGARCIATRKGGVMTRMDRNATNTGTLTTGGFNKVAMTQAVEDRGSGYDSGNGRFKCVYPGDYQIRLSALPTSMSTVTALSVAVYKNGSAQPYRAECAQFAGSLQVTASMRLNQGDYVELYIYYTSGAGNLVIDGNVDWTNTVVKQLAA